MPVVRLTDRSIKALKAPESGRVEIRDELVTGLIVRVGITGRPVFFCRYRTPHGKRRRMTLGTYPVMSLADARTEAKGILAAVARGDDPAAEKERPLPETFGEVADLFLRRHVEAKLAPSTAKEYRRIIDNEARPKWGKMPVTKIRRAHVIDLLDAMVDRGAAVGANRVRAVLHRLFNWAIGRDLIEVNPVYGVPRPGRETRRERVLSDAEIKTLWGALKSESEPIRSLYRFLLLTGQRGGETRRMKWDHVDLEAATWSIPGPERKGGRPHRVPLSPQAVEILKGLRKRPGKSPYVFQSSGTQGAKKQPVKWLSHATARLRKASGFTFRPHDLRRTAASGMAALGVDRDTLGKVLGHKSIDAGVIAVYDRYDRAKEKREALDAWGERVERIVQPKQDASTAAGAA